MESAITYGSHPNDGYEAIVKYPTIQDFDNELSELKGLKNYERKQSYIRLANKVLLMLLAGNPQAKIFSEHLLIIDAEIN